MLKGLTPIVRGRCTECGFTRNLWVKEIGETIPCNHREDGCPGEMEAAYTGPKKFMPAELESSACTCAERKAREAAIQKIKQALASGDVEKIAAALEEARQQPHLPERPSKETQQAIPPQV